MSFGAFGAIEFDIPFTMTGDFQLPDRSRSSISMTVFFINIDVETIEIGAVSYEKDPASGECGYEIQFQGSKGICSVCKKKYIRDKSKITRE